MAKMLRQTLPAMVKHSLGATLLLAAENSFQGERRAGMNAQRLAIPS